MATKNNNSNFGLEVRFGIEILEEGHTSIPNLVLFYYRQLGITHAEMMFAIQIWQYWWSEKNPYPGIPAIAKRMKCSDRQARNYLKSLKEKGYVITSERKEPGRGQLTNVYDFSPMFVAILECSERENREDVGSNTPLNNPSGGGVKQTSGGALNNPSGEEYTLQKDEDNSNRRLSPKNENQEEITPDSTTPTADQANGYQKARAAREALKRGEKVKLEENDAEPSRAHAQPPPQPDEDGKKRWIEHYLRDLNTMGFNDKAPLPASVGRAMNLKGKYEPQIGWTAFQMAMERAKVKTQKNVQNIKSRDSGPGIQRKRKMGYYFSVFEQELKILAEQIQQPASPP